MEVKEGRICTVISGAANPRFGPRRATAPISPVRERWPAFLVLRPQGRKLRGGETVRGAEGGGRGRGGGRVNPRRLMIMKRAGKKRGNLADVKGCGLGCGGRARGLGWVRGGGSRVSRRGGSVRFEGRRAAWVAACCRY